MTAGPDAHGRIAIREAEERDHDAVWAIIEPAIRSGEVFAIPRSQGRDQALAGWFGLGHSVYVAESDGVVRGTYYLRANQQGPGSHVANCSYATDPSFQGHGIAAAMCADSLDQARTQGFRAMQFNLVIATNTRAVELWRGMGFAVVGRIPEAYEHATLGFVDAMVMHRRL